MHENNPTRSISNRARLIKSLRAFRRDMLVFAVDFLVLFTLWILNSVFWNALIHQTRDFLSIPLWAVMLIVAETAILWQSFGLSPGMKMMGRQLVDRRTNTPSTGSYVAALGRRAYRILLWHTVPVSFVRLLSTTEWNPWHDHLTGLTMVGAVEVEDERRPWYARSWSVSLVLLFASSMAAASLFAKVDIVRLFTDFHRTERIWSNLFRPDWSFLSDGVQGMIETFYLAFMATVFGTLVAIPLSFLAARNLTQGIIGRVIYTLVRGVTSIVRSIEPIIWVIIFVVWVWGGAFAGVLALFLHSVADLTKLYSERLESIDPGPVEAITATGAGRLQTILYGVVPQIVNPYLSFTIYRADINVRMSVIVGIVGGGGIGTRLLQSIRGWDFQTAAIYILLIIIVVWTMDYASARLRARLG